MRAALVLAALVAAAACGCARAEPPTPLLWEVSDADNSVYLLGAFHALEPGDYPLAPAVDAAFADAERVRFELDPLEMESPDLPLMMAAAAKLPAGQTLRSQLSPGTWAKLEAHAQARGLPLELFAQTEPWFVSLVITLGEMQRLGLDPEQGLDRHLAARAKAAGKPTGGLETAAEQIGALDSMNPEEQEQALLEAIDEADDLGEQMRALHAAWRRGDDQVLYDRMGADLRDRFPRLYRRINVDRNAAWVPKIRALLDDPGKDDTLIVVGALHLLGNDGVVERLRAAGYTVKRL